MGVTAIKKIVNNTDRHVFIQCLENPGKGGNSASVRPGQSATCNMWIPWCIGSDQWKHHHIWLSWMIYINGVPASLSTKFYWIWQNGDFVRASTDGKWKSAYAQIPGECGVNGDRIVIVESLEPVRVRMDLH
jgi:hypothetical protein